MRFWASLFNSPFSDFPCGRLKSALVGLFTQWKLANATNQSIFFSESQFFSKLEMMGREMGCGFESHIDQNSDHYRAQLDPLQVEAKIYIYSPC